MTRPIRGGRSLRRSILQPNIERQRFRDEESNTILADVTDFPSTNKARLTSGKVNLHVAPGTFSNGA